MKEKVGGNSHATAEDWRAATRADRKARAETLVLPSGATIRAARPEPLEWIISGRIPQGLLRVVLNDQKAFANDDRQLSREEIIELAKFAVRIVEISVVDPPIGEGPGAISLDDIPLRDRAYIFEWACRALSGKHDPGANVDTPHGFTKPSNQEELSSDKLERFCSK